MTKVDELIEKFKEFKEELNKNVNASYAPGANGTMGASGGQGGMYRSEKMSKDGLMGPSPGGAQDMQMIKWDKNGQWKLEDKKPLKKTADDHLSDVLTSFLNKAKHFESKDGTNREANPKLRQCDIGSGGKVHLVKEEKPHVHNTADFKVMPMKPDDKDEKHPSPGGLPYSGKDKDVKKDEDEKKKKGHIQGNDAKGFDENKAPGRGTLSV